MLKFTVMPFWALVLKSSGEKSISGYVSGNIYIYILYIYIYIYPSQIRNIGLA